MTVDPRQLRQPARWLLVGAGLGLVLLNPGLAGLTFLALIGLAAVAWIPRFGPAVLRRIGWARLPIIGGLTGLAASAALVGSAFGVVVTHVALVPPSPSPNATPAAAIVSAAPTPAVAPRSTDGASAATTTTAPERASASPVIPAPPEDSRQSARVVSVTDGDTIRVEINGRSFAVRYIGIDTPETVAPGRPVDPYGPEASDANKRLVEGQTVTLEKDVSETDRFGRLLRYVYLEGPAGRTMVNAELVRLGYARVSTYPPDVKYQGLFLDLEREARDAGRGLWAAAGATPAAVAVASATPPPAAPTASPLPQSTPVPTARATATPVRTLTPSPTPSPVPTPAPTAAPTTSSTATLAITALVYDGAVPRSEADEYVQIRNTGLAPVSLAGWRIVSERAGQTYSFPAILMQPGQTCRVYTNQVHTQWCGLSWGRGSAVWNNTGDRANLVSPTGVVVSSSGYGGW